MNILYIHIPADGLYTYRELPAFAEYSVIQSRLHHEGNIFFACEESQPWFADKGVTWLDLRQFKSCIDFYTTQLQDLNYNTDKFWLNTMIRMFLIHHITKTLDLTNVIHLEYDNMIYRSTTQLEPYFTDKIRYTIVSSTEGSPGIMLIPSKEVAGCFFSEFARSLSDIYKEKRWLTDMSVLKELEYSSYVEVLPTLPSKTDTLLFDGATYGQYLGGSNNGHSPKHTDVNHYVTQAIARGTAVMKDSLPPLVEVDGREIPIFNLHIHSKQLKQFLC